MPSSIKSILGDALDIPPIELDLFLKKLLNVGFMYASGNHIFTAGTQLCGNSSSIALALCVGNR
ncbi:MAG: hypothetical protein AB2652_18470, partial [Candidatus Thiodiazotropha endolucinida]